MNKFPPETRSLHAIQLSQAYFFACISCCILLSPATIFSFSNSFCFYFQSDHKMWSINVNTSKFTHFTLTSWIWYKSFCQRPADAHSLEIPFHFGANLSAQIFFCFISVSTKYTHTHTHIYCAILDLYDKFIIIIFLHVEKAWKFLIEKLMLSWDIDRDLNRTTAIGYDKKVLSLRSNRSIKYLFALYIQRDTISRKIRRKTFVFRLTFE